MKILVIRLSALGDVILSFATFAAIRAHHPQAHITFLTTPPFKDLLAQAPYFDDVVALDRAPGWNLRHWLRLRKILRRGRYDIVYDIQRNDRTALYRRLAPHKTLWLGNDRADYAHNAAALDASDIRKFAQPDFGWMAAKAKITPPPAPYALLVPGSAPQHPEKRWPAQHYAALAQKLVQTGVTPVVLGTASEADATAAVAAVAGAVDMTGKTNLHDIAALALQSTIAIGNDTGPMHLISLCGCPVVSLFSAKSDPAKSAPRGPVVKALQCNDLSHLSVDEVFARAQTLRR